MARVSKEKTTAYLHRHLCSLNCLFVRFTLMRNNSIKKSSPCLWLRQGDARYLYFREQRRFLFVEFFLGKNTHFFHF